MAEPRSPIISARDLRFRYEPDGPGVLDGVDLDVEPGQFVVVFGEAKSTLLLTLCGAIPHVVEGELAGRVLLDGQDTRETPLSTLARTVGMVLQDPENQLFNLTVAGDVVFGMENLGVPRDEMEQRLDEALRLVRVEDLRDRAPNRLSGGQKQRVAIAAVLAMRPPILLLDEPTRELDPLGTEEVFGVLASLKERGNTVVLVENDPDHVAPLADRMILLGEGRVLVDAPPREFYRRASDDPRVRLPQITELALRRENGAGTGRPGWLPLTVEEGVPAIG
jgi:energy-coupling factor transporter ATP-binding protein EcfA2